MDMKKAALILCAALTIALAGCAAPAANVVPPQPTEAAFAEPTPTPELTPEPTPIKTVDPAVAERDFKKSCKKLDYNAYARNPDKYGMQSVYFTGEVVQVLEDYTDEVQMRIAVNEDYDKMMFVYFTLEGDRILEDDIVTVYGYTSGLLSYESTMGATITIPSVMAAYIDVK
jgi:hypothetical protein